jgi:hypothetical protein
MAVSILLFVALFLSVDSLKLWMDHSPKNSKQLLQDKLSKFVKFTAFSTVLIRSQRASANTFFDVDVYGDKELKIATVNKLKQKLRNAILSDPTIASDLIKIAINDALGFDPITKNGGSDGSILFELDQEENSSLEKAKNLVLQIQNELKRTNTLSFADVCAFAGSEALESVGSGRITVQIGRFDTKEKNKKQLYVNWKAANPQDSIRAFTASGVDLKDALVLLSAIGEVQRIVTETIATKNQSSSEDDEDEPFEADPFVPSTFGSREDIFGAKIGKGNFGVGYLIEVLKGNKIDDLISQVILSQPNAKPILSKYIGNDSVYRKDVAEAYGKLTQIGESYTNRNA